MEIAISGPDFIKMKYTTNQLRNALLKFEIIFKTYQKLTIYNILI